MRVIATYAMVGVLLAMAVGERVSAEPQVTLTVRLYNTSGIPSLELVAARRAVEATFQDTGLDLIVRHCGPAVSPEEAGDQCTESLKPLEVVVRVIKAPAFNPTLHPEAYGVAYLVKETERGWLATAFSDRIAGAATRVGVDAGTLLGLVIAHEVGHLLLGSKYHSWNGVMRADWPDVLLNHKREQLGFSSLEAAKMRHVASIRF